MKLPEMKYNPLHWWTVFVIVGIIAILIGWDIYVAVQKPSATISSILLYWAQRHPVAPFIAGVLCGHWFWPQPRKE